MSWTVANTTISVDAIVNFVFIIFGTWILSQFMNTVLKVEIFSRFKFPRGIPTAITTVLNYTLVISGGIIALSSLGVTPEQFTLVFGGTWCRYWFWFEKHHCKFCFWCDYGF